MDRDALVGLGRSKMNFDIISIKVDELGDLKFRLAHSGCRLAVVSRSQLGKIRPWKPSGTSLRISRKRGPASS